LLRGGLPERKRFQAIMGKVAPGADQPQCRIDLQIRQVALPFNQRIERLGDAGGQSVH